MQMIDTLEYATDLVKKWGESRLPDGRKLAETLTIEGIPLWDALSVDLARIYIPAAISANISSSKISIMLRPYLIRFKYSLRHFIRNKYNTNGCFSWKTDKTILCLDFSEHISRDVLQPLAIGLADHSDYKVVSLSENSWKSKHLFAHQNGSFQTIWQHWDKQVIKNATKIKKDIRRLERELLTSNFLMNVIQADNSLLWKKLEKVFYRFFRSDLPLLASQAAVAKHILSHHHPSLLISGDVADPRTRIYSLLCRQMGIPCLEIQFGLVGEEGIEWRFFSSDVLSVWGENSKQVMLKHGVPEDKIKLTGSPRHDVLVNVSESEVKSVRTKIGVPENSKMVLLASSYQLNAYNEYSSPELFSFMKSSIFNAADRTQGIWLVVKPHPSENVRETKMLARNKRNIIFVSKKSDIRELTRICDAFISFGSTATVDALIAGKLVICPVFSGWIWSDLFKNSRATLLPTSPEEILKIFELIANGHQEELRLSLETSRQEFLSQWIYKTNVSATDRIVELALGMMKSS